MGSVVGIRRKCCTLNSKPSSGSEAASFFCSSKSLFSFTSRSLRTFLPDCGRIQSSAQHNPPHSSHQSFIFLASILDVPGCRVWLVPEQSLPPWVAAKAGGMKLSSVQKGTESVSRGGGAALVKPPHVCQCSAGWERFWKGGHGSGAEVSQVDWARFMLVKRSTGHLWLSELIGRLHSSVHWL